MSNLPHAWKGDTKNTMPVAELERRRQNLPESAALLLLFLVSAAGRRFRKHPEHRGSLREGGAADHRLLGPDGRPPGGSTASFSATTTTV